ncbi:uncharacterized protein LACBIDRAFT_334347 [Laccaria bicolor S238N-H82]|uniref:guanosine-diphosphatase n=1 Tax=Laccaria bicolor (strain S238N-H82 / ATCC MYA-4686) TaxID=486041 RepID=B0DYX4_LACBS|nr:uncharacterized protein LACBIDRAFT_334347 [Laccaria bicolor S238N-H82]EDR00220.1 predicted protein [Laccaria bicolor S238N-H82]|eukprot:XP_001889129.1 predicted protein [Laccaria bicolor S238N-H82]
MDFKDEGIYEWITADYLFGTIKASTPPDTPAYAILYLGGASTQIVSKPIFASSDMQLEEGEHKYNLQFGGRNHVLYQHSYLGYGLMCAWRHVHRLVNFMSTLQGTKAKAVVDNLCLAKGTWRVMTFKDEGTLGLLRCVIGWCKSANSNHAPQRRRLTLPPLLLPKRTTRQVCQGHDEWLWNHWGTGSELMAELADRPEWHLDLTFMHALLRLGYEFEDGREAAIGKKIQGMELGWCLGAMIAMVGGEMKCWI